MTQGLDSYSDLRFMFDVESAGLHGEGFAYGYVVTGVNKDTGSLEVIEEGEKYSIDGAKEALALGESFRKPEDTTDFFKDMIDVLPVKDFLDAPEGAALPEHIVRTNREVRDGFWEAMSRWKANGADIYSDVNWPVEANFLSAVIKDDLPARQWGGPFPLKDASNEFSKLAHLCDNPGSSLDRAKYAGLGGLHKHNPKDDAKASAFGLHKAEREIAQRIVAHASDALGTEIGDGAAFVKKSEPTADRQVG